MADHVDIVKNEWSAGLQIRLVTVAHSAQGDVLLANTTPGWDDLLRRKLRDRAGETVVLEAQPDLAFPVLAQTYAGDYVFASDPHDDSDCPFRYGPVLSMRPLPDDAVAKLATD